MDKKRNINFSKDGDFFNKHPDVYGNVTKYERTDVNGNIIEVWERNEAGVLVDVTERVLAERELVEAEKALNKLKENNNG